MATTNARDVSLVIRARDEATAAIESVTASLNKLFAGQQSVAGSSKTTGSSLAEMAAVMASVDKAVSSITGTADRAEEAFNRMSSALTRRKQELADYQRQAQEAQRAISLLNGPNAIVGAGRDQGPRIAQVRELQNVYDGLQKKIAAVTSTIAAEEQRIEGSRSSLQELGSTALAATAQQEKLTAALKARQEAARTLAEQDQRAAQAQAGLGALNARISPTLAGETASSRGATTSALVAREEVAALKEAAQAHALFEARVKQGAAELRIKEAAEHSDAEALQQLMRELNPLTALQEKFAAKLELARKAKEQNKITSEQLAVAEKQLANEMKRAEADVARNGRQGVSLFGLRPYELTNFSFQINDIVTQLASGTSLMQTLAQQGGQILQLFPRIGSSIMSALGNPLILAGAVAFGAVALAVKRAADETQRLRDIQATLDLNAAGGGFKAQALLDTVHAMHALGAASEDATKAVKTFLQEGLDESRFQQFGRLAVETSRVLGVDVPAAANDLADAFTGGYDAIARFDDKLNFLTASQREHIRTLFEQGKAEEARRAALDIFSQKMDDVADKQQGDWTRATTALASAWDTLMLKLSDTAPIQATYTAMKQLAGIIDRVANRISGLRTIGDVAAELDSAQQRLDSFNKFTKSASNSSLVSDNRQNESIRKELQQRVDDLKHELTQLQGQASKSNVTNQNENTAAAKRRNDKLAELSIDEEIQQLRAKATEGLTQAEKARREELAGMIAIRGEADAQVAAAKKKNAVEKEHNEILKEQKTLNKSNAADRDRAISQFTSRVVGAEGGTGQNPNSSAVGFGQFVDKTWLEQYKKLYSDSAASLSNQQILALRNNETVAKGIIEQYAKENASFLERFGKQVTAGNLYLAHFLGPGGALKILNAQGDTPVDKLLSDQVLKGNRGYLFDSKEKRYRTAAELQQFIAGRIGDSGAAQSAGQAEIAKLQQDAIDKQDDFNRSVAAANGERQRTIDALKEQNKLQDTALVAAEKRAAVDKAEYDLLARVAEINNNLKQGQKAVEVTDEQIRRTRELAAAEFELQHAREAAQAKANEITRPLDDITAERDALQSRIDYLNQNGLLDQAQALQPELEAVNGKLAEAIDKAIQFYEALDLANDPLHRTQEQIDAIITKLKTQRDETRNWVNILGVSGKQIAQVFSSGAVSAIDRFAQSIANGQNAFKSLWQTFRQFAADFLIQIAKMIEQQIIFKLISGALSSLGPGTFSPAAGPISGVGPISVAHTGGVIGSDKLQTRMAPPSWFLNATRYHTGGIAGFKPNELPAILQRNEEVLTTSDPRHRFNGGGSSEKPLNVKVINAFDAADMLSKALETKAGQRTILNFLGNNSRAVGQTMGGS